MKMKCAIFDFDGTLFDSMFIWDSAGEMYLRSLGVEPKPGMKDAVNALSLYQAACYFREEYGLPLSPEEIMAGINRTVEDFYIHEVKPKPGVRDFLERMQQNGISMGIATASDRYQIEAALRRCGMEHYFDAIFTCTEVGHGKDEPHIFRAAMSHFGGDPGNSLVFEDALHAIRTAKSAGFTVAAVYDPSETHQEGIRGLADFYIEDFRRISHEDENSLIHRRQ